MKIYQLSFFSVIPTLVTTCTTILPNTGGYILLDFVDWAGGAVRGLPFNVKTEQSTRKSVKKY